MSGDQPEPPTRPIDEQDLIRELRRRSNYHITGSNYACAGDDLDEWCTACLFNIAADRVAQHAQVLAENATLRAQRDANIALSLELGQILGPAYDGVDLRDVAHALVQQTSENASLKEALAKFGRHVPGCFIGACKRCRHGVDEGSHANIYAMGGGACEYYEPMACSCGWAALAPQEPT